MKTSLRINTQRKKQLIDITSQVEEFIEESRTEDGITYIFAKHTTCALIISEIEDNLEKDIINYLEREGPKGPFVHSHGDLAAHDLGFARESHTPAHLMSAIIGQSIAIPVSEGKLDLGTWQRICLLELDGPRVREVIVYF